MRTKAYIPEQTFSEVYFNIWKSGKINQTVFQKIQHAINSESLKKIRKAKKYQQTALCSAAETGVIPILI